MLSIGHASRSNCNEKPAGPNLGHRGENREARKQVNQPTPGCAGETDFSDRGAFAQNSGRLTQRWIVAAHCHFRHASTNLSTLALAIGMAFCLSSAASTAAHAAAFTLAGPLAITGGEPGNPGVIGTLLPVGIPSSLGDSIQISAGDTSFVTNDVIVFALSLSGGSLLVDQIGLGANSIPLLPNPVGGGSFNAGGTEAPDSVTIGSFTTLTAAFDYSGNILAPGETTQNLFVTYSPAGFALSVGSGVNISISSGTNFTVQTTLVPEPSTALLLAGGLFALGAQRRSKRSYVTRE